MKVFKSEGGKKSVLESYDKLVAQWGVDTEEKFIETKFGKTHVFLVGDKSNPPLLMFHGVGDNSAVMWVMNMHELSQHFYCIAIDTLGGPGKSEPNDHYVKNEFNIIGWINDLVRQLKLDRFYMVGVSHGAYLVFLYTTHEKEKVIKTVCIEGGIITNPLRSMIRTLMLAFPEILIPTRKNIIKIMKKMKPGSDLFEKHPEVIDHMVLVMKSHNQVAMTPHTLEKYNRDSGIAVRDKLYFLFGSNLQDKRNSVIELLNEGQYSYKIFDGAGHGLNMEKPEMVNKEIVTYLNGQ